MMNILAALISIQFRPEFLWASVNAIQYMK